MNVTSMYVLSFVYYLLRADRFLEILATEKQYLGPTFIGKHFVSQFGTTSNIKT